MEKLKIKVILGSTRPSRFGIQPAEFIMNEAKKLSDFDVELVDLKHYPVPFFEEAISPAYSKEPYTNENVNKLASKIAEGDAFIMITPEYNHSFSAVLKNTLDYIYKEWNRKPVAFVSYGSVGGARAVEQLRLVVAELQMVSIRPSLLLQNIWTNLDESGKFKVESYVEHTQSILQDLLWWAKTLRDGRMNK